MCTPGFFWSFLNLLTLLHHLTSFPFSLQSASFCSEDRCHGNRLKKRYWQPNRQAWLTLKQMMTYRKATDLRVIPQKEKEGNHSWDNETREKLQKRRERPNRDTERQRQLCSLSSAVRMGLQRQKERDGVGMENSVCLQVSRQYPLMLLLQSYCLILSLVMCSLFVVVALNVL